MSKNDKNATGEKTSESTVENKTEEKTKKKTEKKKEEIVEEKIYTIPLTHSWIAPIKKRTPRAMNILKEFIKKNLKMEDFVISKEVNERLWSRGIEGVPRKVRVRVVKDKDGVVTVYLAKGG